MNRKLFENLTNQLHRLPGVGPKMAERIAYHIIRMKADDAAALCEGIRMARTGSCICSCCFNIAETNPCHLCADVSRKQDLICVVEHPQDVSAVERSGGFNGLYHVLHGSLSPLDGIGPDDLKIDELVKRIKNMRITELIIATNPDVEGEATALYLSKLLKPLDITITRIAQGIPFGGELEYADQGTLLKALQGRRAM
ncbi:MAG: recombination protein RecR [Elusimicrobia bacterium]|nr:recombination protein RecR [Elusimicrobiota bacterium]MBD3411794.1 recombination protein RecR [Elusimicrobiota bacterium]